ncbi:MAG TPA: porin family protein [Candidatus Mcinerneyibacteriales bacterium]|nr:porin family protein [Candidatus Mcinerneyibacteriales bacterium]HPE28937.1 porin family protein [Candidatus Mcinerneyibacteriales bacterium]HPJ69436.1 porin family protein [Candidatus Mcinerneyibacteriales bacterium]HPQ89158.1 porin family protein [Candidatus Mcinerneyibacteriales bacterium]
MKKTVMMVICLGFLLSGVSALEYGPKVGLAFSKYTDEIEGLAPKFKTGFLLGAFLRIPVTGTPLTVIGEALYTQKGCHFEENGFDADIRMDYFELALLGKYPVLPHVGVYLGPSLAFLTKAEIEEDGGGSVDLTDEFKGSEFSLNIGGQVDVSSFVFDLRFNFGLTDINDSINGGDFSIKTNTLSLSAGYIF